MTLRAPHTKRGTFRANLARAGTPEDWHRAWDHEEYYDAECSLCVAIAYKQVLSPVPEPAPARQKGVEDAK